MNYCPILSLVPKLYLGTHLSLKLCFTFSASPCQTSAAEAVQLPRQARSQVQRLCKNSQRQSGVSSEKSFARHLLKQSMICAVKILEAAIDCIRTGGMPRRLFWRRQHACALLRSIFQPPQY